MSQTIAERIKEAQLDMDKAKAFLPYGHFNDGENTFDIDLGAPLEKSKFGQTTYTGTLNGEKVKISIAKSVEMQILLGVQKKKTSFKITKSGSGLKTKYIVK